MGGLGELTWQRAALVLVAGGLLVWMWLGDLPAAVLVACVFAAGLAGLWTAATMTPANQDERLPVAGPGWLLAVALRRLPFPIARGVMALLGLGICALGVAGAATML